MDRQAFAAVKAAMTEAPARTAPPFDTLAETAVGRAGVPAEAGRSVLVQALGLLEKHADPHRMAALYVAIPGAEDVAVSKAAKPRAGGGLFGGVMRSAGGVSGAAMADAMGLLDRAKKQGLDQETLKALAQALRGEVRAATGRDLLGEALKSVPGVGRMLAGD